MYARLNNKYALKPVKTHTVVIISPWKIVTQHIRTRQHLDIIRNKNSLLKRKFTNRKNKQINKTKVKTSFIEQLRDESR